MNASLIEPTRTDVDDVDDVDERLTELQRTIARRADEISLQTKGTKDSDFACWLKAEEEIIPSALREFPA